MPSSSDAVVHDPDGGMPRLVEIMRRLRDPVSGCPWDIEQDFATIAPYTIEEAYEVADAIQRGDMEHLREELGDLLLQVVYHAQMAEEQGAFTFKEVSKSISDKMIDRHPHVFGEERDDRDAAGQVIAWEAQKAAERARKGAGRPTLSRPNTRTAGVGNVTSHSDRSPSAERRNGSPSVGSAASRSAQSGQITGSTRSK